MNDNAARPCPVSVDDIAAELLAAMWRATLDLRDAAIALRDDPTGAAAVEAFDLATAVMNRPLEEWLRRIGNVSESRGLEEPFYSDDLVTLYRGDSLTMLQQLESETNSLATTATRRAGGCGAASCPGTRPGCAARTWGASHHNANTLCGGRRGR